MPATGRQLLGKIREAEKKRLSLPVGNRNDINEEE